MKILSLKRLTQAVTLTMLVYSSNGYADVNLKGIGDLEIYQPAEAGAATIAMMLDISGSMLEVDAPSHIAAVYDPRTVSVKCIYKGRQRVEKYTTTRTVTVPVTDKDGKKIEDFRFNITGCDENASSNSFGLSLDNSQVSYPRFVIQGYPDRISNLKLGMIGLLANGQSLSANNKIGAGHFSVVGTSTGAMSIPSQVLTLEHRKRLMKYISELKALGATPTAPAYAEVGAYMLGTSTLDASAIKETRFVPYGLATLDSAYWWRYSVCNFLSPNMSSMSGAMLGSKDGKYYNCGYTTPLVSNIPFNRNSPYYGANKAIQDFNLPSDTKMLGFGNRGSNIPNTIWFGQERTGYWASHGYSGFGFSDNSTKKSDAKSYASPVSSQGAQCDGYGIYFLTDGEPNRADPHYTPEVMKQALAKNSFSCRGGLSTYGVSDTNGQSGWDCIGAFAKALREPNPSGQAIKTATVGFGGYLQALEPKRSALTEMA